MLQTKEDNLSKYRKDMFLTIKDSKQAKRILANCKLHCEILKNGYYEQRWEDVLTKNIYSVFCEDMEVSNSKIAIKSLGCL